MNLFRQREEKFARNGLEAVGGAGVTDIIRIDGEGQENSRKRLISVRYAPVPLVPQTLCLISFSSQPITTLAISLTSSLLLVGTATGLIQIYDIASHQLLRTISTHKGFSITHLSTMLKPPDLVGHVSLSLGTGSTPDARESIPVKPVTPFQRMRDPKARELHEVAIMLPAQPSVSTMNPNSVFSLLSSLLRQRSTEAFFEYSTDELLRDHAVFVKAADIAGSGTTGVSLQSRVTELESEVSKLREQLGKAKGINDTMWETIVQKMVTETKEGKGKGKGASDDGFVALDDEDDDSEGVSRRRKRTRS